MWSTIAVEIDYQVPARVLARVSMCAYMLFGSSLPSRLRGVWDDSSFVVDFYMISDPDSALGISIASN